MNDGLLFCHISFSSFYEETGEPTEYFWQIDRKIQFGECLRKPKTMPKMTGDNGILTLIFTFSVLGLKQEEELRNERKEFPPCNVEYKADPERTRFWCTTVSLFWLNFEFKLLKWAFFQHSGGIERDWAGYPIQLFNQDEKTFACVCVQKEHFDLPQFRPYENCDEATRSCFMQSEEQASGDE